VSEGAFSKKNVFDQKLVFFLNGVNVMITIFGDFEQSLAKKLAIFLKSQCYGPGFTNKT
jgi:hypothetical protein